MPDNQVIKDFNVKLHGSGVANCGSYPVIKAVGSIQFTRNPGSDQVSWSVSGMGRSSCLPTSTTASFGYKFLAYIEVNGTRYNLIIKDNTQGSGWTSSTYTKIYTPSGTFTSTADTTTIRFVVKGNTCMSGGNYCYRTSGYKTIATYTIELPPYQTDYTVTYNANGGKDAPAPQSRPNTEPGSITLTTIVPIYPVSITYHNNPEYAIAVNRPFIKWNTAADGSGTDYAPGDVYSDDANLLLYAQWGEATFTPIVPNDNYYVLTYAYNGADPGYPATTLVPRVKLGYDDDSSASSVVYNVGTSYTTTTDVDLYPVYGTATIAVTDMVSPTRHGHVFEGWYTDPELTHKITTDLVMTGDVTVYANWIPMPIRQFTNGTWEMSGQFVWQYDASDSMWKKIAPIYAFNGTYWANMSGGPAPVEVTTAKVGIANFTTSLARPLVNLTAYFKATQEAGTPTPQSPKAISGVSEVSVIHCHKNLYQYVESKVTTGTTSSSTTRAYLPLGVKGSGVFTFKATLKSGQEPTIHFVNIGKIKDGIITVLQSFIQGANLFERTISYNEGDEIVLVSASESTYSITSSLPRYDIQIEVGSQATTYEAYNGSTTLINLGGTYYGGYISQDKDGKRELVVTHSDLTDLGSFTWNSSNDGYTQSPIIDGMKKTASGSTMPDMFCNKLKVDTPSNVYNKVTDGSISIAITTANSGLRVYLTTLAGLNASQVKSALGGIYIAYPLETPFTIPLTDGEPITAFNGVNNIYNNSSDSQVTYLATPEEAEAAQQRSLSKGSPSEEPEEEEEKPEEEPIEEPKDTGNER